MTRARVESAMMSAPSRTITRFGLGSMVIPASMADRLCFPDMSVPPFVRSARSGKVDAVVAPRGFGRHVALGHVARHRGAVPFRCGAIAPAAARHNPHDLALGDGVLRGFADV